MKHGRVSYVLVFKLNSVSQFFRFGALDVAVVDSIMFG